MKIGIASNDEISVAQHFGRTRGFVISEIRNGEIVAQEYRQNLFTQHVSQPNDRHTHSHHHSHDSIIQALGDCQVVISRGMGRRIYEDLRGANIQSMITSLSGVDETLHAYLIGKLENYPDKGCEH